MELLVVTSNCQPEISTRMFHLHLKFRMSETKLLILSGNHCQLTLFLLLCPQLTKWHYHPPSCLHQKPRVILDSSFSLISISNPSASSSRLTSNIYLKSVHFSPWSCSSSCHYLLPGLVQNLSTHLPALPLAPSPHNSFFMPICESELLKA